ncbi:MAG TPA: hydantoinase/oxoprolinase family protein [Nitrolancea sp.]|jgi:N-methylhydantoinase A|nr:hydantoinase/oxoprolinase family protein [Nitrolancea sp.]
MRISTDIGGTFTDLVCHDEQTDVLHLAKVSTTPDDYARGVIETIAKAQVDAASARFFVHGATVVINALTERSGARTGLITTQGFRDVLEIGRANRSDIYNFAFRKPVPFVPRYLRLEVLERVNYKGQVLTPLDEDALRASVRSLLIEDVEAIAICFIHSYANPDHERRAAEIVREEAPQLAVTASHEVTREWREYERTNTVVLNAYIQPTARRYLNTLEQSLTDQGMPVGALHVMQSNGGIATFEQGRGRPIRMVESGPVGGVIGAMAIGKILGLDNLITLDIGGTTAKSSLIQGGMVRTTNEYKIEWTPTFPGYPVMVPVVDIVEIGAGGGSIAWVDRAGALKVGPRSAGALPGPACYGKGGDEPTVTDANLLAGRINPDYFLGGEIDVSIAAARQSMEKIARPFDLSTEDAALGIIRLANANMDNLLRLVSVRRGLDPRDFALIAFGGGGSMHATALARGLHINTVVVPIAPAHFSAWGMLMTDLRTDLVQTAITRADRLAGDDVERLFAGLEREAIDEFVADGIDRSRIVIQRSADMRYLGQEHTVKVPIPAQVDADAFSQIVEHFNQLHEQFFTFRLDRSSVEFVNFHITAFGAVDKPGIPRLSTDHAGAGDARKGTRFVDFDEMGRHESTIYERDRLAVGATISGPAVIEEPAASTVLFPDDMLRVDEFGNLIIQVGR